MGISLTIYNFVPMIAGSALVIFPFIYIKYLKNTGFKCLFLIIQIVLILVTVLLMVAAKKLNREVDIPDEVVFFSS